MQLSDDTIKMEDELARLQARLEDAEASADQAACQVATMLSREKHILAQKRQLQEDIDRLRLQMTRATLPTTKYAPSCLYYLHYVCFVY